VVSLVGKEAKGQRGKGADGSLIVRSLIVGLGLAVSLSAQEKPAGQGFSFRSNTDLINVTVTVTDENGRFVSGLTRDDFVLHEDGKPQPVQQFDSDRVPVSLGIALDTSGSMAGEKIKAAEAALNRFLFDLLGKNDQVFLYRFDSRPTLIQGWTSDRSAVSRALGAIRPGGGTAMFDTVLEAVPLTQKGSERKKALIVISDGEDTSSHVTARDVQQQIRESEVLVYAIAIDPGATSSTGSYAATASTPNVPASKPVPSPFPGRKPAVSPPPPPPAPTPSRSTRATSGGTGTNTLRMLTDDSGGRTEIIQSHRDLDPATAGIADELSRQYFLGYISAVPKDGRWHTIDVQVRKGNGRYRVRARTGFVAG
jgi:Ca-activated chloride channel family protein